MCQNASFYRIVGAHAFSVKCFCEFLSLNFWYLECQLLAIFGEF